MGDFHGTCFASSLPIFQGEGCAAILMVKNPYGLLQDTYPNRRYLPITAPIRGKYNGYGGVVPVCDDNFEVLEAFVLDRKALLHAKEPTAGTRQEIAPVTSLSDALDHAVRGELLLNGKEFYRGGSPVVEIGLLHGRILSFAEAEYRGHQQHAEKALRSLLAAKKESGLLSPGAMQMEEAFRYAIFDDGFMPTFLVQAVRQGYDPSSLAAVSRMLQNHRLRFIPGSGAGGQNGVESRRQLAYYQLVANLAEDIFNRANNY